MARRGGGSGQTRAPIGPEAQPAPEAPTTSAATEDGLSLARSARAADRIAGRGSFSKQ